MFVSSHTHTMSSPVPKRRDRSCPTPEELGSINELIANLDHELWEVRYRALKSILEKIECSIVTTNYLARRIDLLQRLLDWLLATLEAAEYRSSPSFSGSSEVKARGLPVNLAVARHGVPFVLKLLLLLAKFNSVRHFIAEEKVDSILVRLLSYIDEDAQHLLQELFICLSTNSFELQLVGSPEVWNDDASNKSARNKTASTDRSFSVEDESCGDIVIFPRIEDMERNQRIVSDQSAGDTYFTTNQTLPSILNKSNEPGFYFGIPSVQLSASDRRVLASAVESVLSKNESLVFSTTCFFHDVLLEDYPPEVFIQESAVSMAFMEVAESPWNDKEVTQAASQALLSLSRRLRLRIEELNSSEFYETKRPVPAVMAHRHMDYSSSWSSSLRHSPPTSDSFLGTLCQLLKSISRTLLFHPREQHLWILMGDFAFTLCKCSHTFPLDYKSLSLGIQEILLDIAYCYEKHTEEVNSTLLVLIFSSLLKALQVHTEVFVVAYDVRQCIRKLSNSTNLVHYWPEVHQHLLQCASPLVDNLGQPLSETSVVPLDDTRHPQTAVKNLLYAIQNATTHQNVLQAIDNIWNCILPLAINARLNRSVLDYICKEAPWRDTFYRFLCVEPTCTEDEQLLVKVLELLNYLIGHIMDEWIRIKEWILPLCMENGCSLFKVLDVHCFQTDMPYSGTVLSNVLRAMFEFYCLLARKMRDMDTEETVNDGKWNIFHKLCLIFHKLGESGFTYSALIAPLLKGISVFFPDPEIRKQMSSNPKFCLALVFRLNECILALQERGLGGQPGEGFRNQGALYYGSLSLYHSLVVIDKCALPNREWIGLCCAVIPCLWDSVQLKTRALGYQICEILTKNIEGVLALMTVLDSPVTIWSTCYNTLMNLEEAAVVKQSAAGTFLKLVLSWDDVQKSTLMKDFMVPRWEILDDVTRLLTHVYWHPTLSEVFGASSTEDTTDTIDGCSSPLVTPKLLTVACKIVIAIKDSNNPRIRPESFPALVCSSGLCAILFRLVGTHCLSPQLKFSSWIDVCSALSAIANTLASLCQLDRRISIILIGDKHSMMSLIQLLSLETPLCSQSQIKLANELMSALRVNIISLLSVLCADAGNNFEDYQRYISNQRNIVFEVLVNWLKADSLARCRQTGLRFLYEFLAKLTSRTSDHVDSTGVKDTGHPILCREWTNRRGTYGTCLCDSLILVYEESNIFQEKFLALRVLTLLVGVSPSAKRHAISKNVVGLLVNKLQRYAVKYYDLAETPHIARKTNLSWLEEVLLITPLLSSLVYSSIPGKKSAMANEILDTCHKIFRWWKICPDPKSLLHAFLELLLNFTEEFPQGCQSLTLTSNTLGVGPKKSPSAQSLLFEILDILQFELSAMDSCDIRTLEYLFEFLKNATLALECRNTLVKHPVFQFLSSMYVRDMKKWSAKQHRIKLLYLQFIHHISLHPDMQIAIARIPEAIDNLVSLVQVGDNTTSMLALQVLRNLCFQSANRTKLLCDEIVIPCLCTKIRESEDSQEINCAAVGLWALLGNCEKAKISAKRCLYPTLLEKTIIRLRKLQQSSNDLSKEKKDLSDLIDNLITVSQLLGSNVSQSTQSLNL